MHALIVRHYRNGGWYPEGGSAAIPATFLAQIEQRRRHLSREPRGHRILVERGRATGVRAQFHQGGQTRTVTFHAPLVISDAGLSATYRLAGREDPLPPSMRTSGMSAVTLYLGLKESPQALGIRGENHYVFDTPDHDEAFARRNDVVRGQAPGVYLSFPSMKDPSARSHTAEILAMVDAEPFVRLARRAVEEARRRVRGAQDHHLRRPPRLRGASPARVP